MKYKNYKLLFGKHKGVCLGDIEEDYIVWCYKNILKLNHEVRVYAEERYNCKKSSRPKGNTDKIKPKEKRVRDPKPYSEGIREAGLKLFKSVKY